MVERNHTNAEATSVATDIAARDWLETQMRVVAYWRDLLMARGGDGRLIEAFDEHAAFLQDNALVPACTFGDGDRSRKLR